MQGAYIGFYQNGMYFEFIRDLEYTDSVGNVTDPTSPGFSRIFKCQYANRDFVERYAWTGFAGHLNERPLSKQSVRIFVEYLWQFRFFWPMQTKVLTSETRESDGRFEHSLLIALLTRRGNDQCDLVELVDWRFSVNKSDGQVYKDFNVIRTIEAQLANGVPVECRG